MKTLRRQEKSCQLAIRPGRFVCRGQVIRGEPSSARESGRRRASWSQRGCGQRGESWRGFQPCGEVPNERFHRGMPEAAETKKIHFIHGLLRGPFFHGHAVGGDEHTGAVVAEAAVHENLLRRIVAKQREKLPHLFIGWR